MNGKAGLGWLLVAALVVFVALAMGWCALRKTLSLVRRLLLFGIGLAFVLVILASAVGISLFW